MSGESLFDRPELDAEAATEERRASDRHACDDAPTVRYLVRPSFQSGQAWLTDVSADGLGLVTDRELSRGAVLVVQLPRRHRGTNCTQLARVLHVTPEGPGRWRIGCRLACRLSDEELAGLLVDDPRAGGRAG